ncbi:MAG: hypothetical protein ACTJHE_11465 [Vibrio casei]
MPDVIISPLTDKPKASVLNKTAYLVMEINGEDVIINYLDWAMSKIGIQSAKVVDGRFPDFKKIDPKKSKVNGAFDVGFSADYLAIPKEILKREKHHVGVKITAYDANSAAKVEFMRMDSVKEFVFLMPIRL